MNIPNIILVLHLKYEQTARMNRYLITYICNYMTSYIKDKNENLPIWKNPT